MRSTLAKAAQLKAAIEEIENALAKALRHVRMMHSSMTATEANTNPLIDNELIDAPMTAQAVQ